MKPVKIAVALLVGLGLTLSGCTKDDGVATLGGKGKKGTNSEASQQAEAAEKMARCLTAAGVKTTAEDADEGQKSITFVTDSIWGYSIDGLSSFMGGGESMEELTEAEWEAAQKRFDELTAKYQGSVPEELALEPEVADSAPPEDPSAAATDAPEAEMVEGQPFLVVGETDHTKAFVKCLKESGYTEPVYHADPAQELKDKKAVVEATTEWLKCARENGYPNLKDPPAPKADEYETMPMALLPTDLTEADARALIKVCPVFDVEAHKKYDSEMAKLNESGTWDEKKWEKIENEFAVVDPNVGFDAPGWNGDWTAEAPAIDAKLEEHLNKLSEIMSEDMQKYYEEMVENEEGVFSGAVRAK
jgi:hypothetical protein